MGSITAPLQAREHIDETLGVDNIVDRSWGGSFDGARHCWLHVRHDRFEGLVLVLVRYTTMHGRPATNVKVVDETMGPGTFDVPDRIWDNRPPVPSDRDGTPARWAVEWRASVEAHRARFPRRVVDLTDDDIGSDFAVTGYGVEGLRFTGWKRHRRGRVPTFNGMRIASWRTARCGTDSHVAVAS